MLRFAWITAALCLAGAALVTAIPAASPNFPARIDLPPGWLAEGIAVGRGHTFYAGNTATGAVYAGDLRTGEGDVLVQPVAGRSALGVFVDDFNRLWVAGGATGNLYVYDASTGALITQYALAPTTPRFINDVYVTNDAAYVTNTSAPVLYRIPLGPGGELGTAFETFVAPPGLNGIEATPDGKTLIVVSITTSEFFTMDAETGATQEIVLDQLVARGDGLILQGRTLYVVENLPSAAFPGLAGEVAVVELSPDLTSGEVVARLNADDEPFVNPATADRFGRWIYVVRRNDAPAGPTRVFWLSRVAADKG
jgi:outer membrane protein assembly factor BamB